MDEKRLLNINEAARFLDKSEKEIKKLVENGALPAYQIGGIHLRFRLEQLKEFQKSPETLPVGSKSSNMALDNIRDFFYFNDFYIMAVAILAFLVFVIVKNIS
ncbi:MAG: helix-turn-helix domain-containing protein [Candidatus Omnitrophica bacterium]|nr:helix-turn-helix domain-containing protein [Candidatus Omnitrophota bacterium]